MRAGYFAHAYKTVEYIYHWTMFIDPQVPGMFDTPSET